MYQNEDTILDNAQSQSYNENEETILDQDNENASAADSQPDAQPEKKGGKYQSLKHIALNGGIGFAVGTLGALLMGATPTPEQGPTTEGDEPPVTPDTPVTTDGTIPVAHSVDDSMSFGEAFQAAHAEVGPGGVFEWHGQLYNTYTEQEWNSLSPSEQQEFASHLKVVGTPEYESNVSHHKTDIYEGPEAEVVAQDDSHGGNTEEHGGNETAEVVDVQTGTEEDAGTVEILGVQQVETADGDYVTVGGAVIDGQEVVVIDINNDGQGDLMASDANNDGQITDNEIIDISSDPIAMSTFTDNSSASTGDDIDYLS